MKLLITILITLSMNIFAGVGDSSGGSTNGRVSLNHEWSEIKEAVKLDRKLEITGDYAFVGRPVSIFDVCATGDSFHTTRKFPIYERKFVGKSRDRDNEKDGYMQVLKENKILTYPLHAIQRKRVCNHHGKQCTYVPVDFIQDTQKSLTIRKHVRTVGSNDRKVFKTLFKKNYSVPECK
jgi:hypothetical protein